MIRAFALCNTVQAWPWPLQTSFACTMTARSSDLVVEEQEIMLSFALTSNRSLPARALEGRLGGLLLISLLLSECCPPCLLCFCLLQLAGCSQHHQDTRRVCCSKTFPNWALPGCCAERMQFGSPAVFSGVICTRWSKEGRLDTTVEGHTSLIKGSTATHQL